MTTFSATFLDRAYSTPDVAQQRARVRTVLAPRSGERGLDVGCGPGLLACELAHDLGPLGRVVGIDTSPEMVAMSEERARRDALAGRTEFRVCDAQELPFQSGAFDFVTVTQVYEYVVDLERALGEAHRVLKPRGRIAVLDTDWESCVWHSEDRDRTARVLKAWEQHFVHPHLPARLPGLLRRTGFALKSVTAVSLVNVELAENTYSHGMIDVIARFVAKAGMSPEEAEQWAADVRRQAEGGEYFFSVSRYLFLAERARLPLRGAPP